MYILMCMFVAWLLVGCSGGDTGDDSAVTCTPAISPLLEVLSVTNTACGSTEGSFSISATGGTGSITYSIDGQNFQPSGVFNGLGPGPYTVTARDTNDCTAEMQVTIESGISFVTEILPVIEVNCAISGCHVSGAQAPDLTDRSNIFSAATRIKNQVETRNMPRGRTLTSTEIEKIICWFNDGSPDN